MYAYTGIYICIFMKSCMYGAPQVRFVCIYTIAMNLHINTFMNMYIYICNYIYIAYMYKYMYVCMCIYIYIYIFRYTCIHINM